MRKKALALVLSAVLAAGCMAGCGSEDKNSGSTTPAATQAANGENNAEATKPADDSGAGKTDNPDVVKADESAVDKLIAATTGQVTLRVWASEEDQEFTQKRIDAFKQKYGSVNFEIELGSCSEAQAKDNVTQDVTAAPDVYTFADDQLIELIKAGALQKVAATYTYDVKEANLPGAVSAATYKGELYAYPMTADNGYFMYYDSTVFTEDDVKSLDSMIAAAQKANKKIAMNLESGWYLYSFFKGAGLEAKLAEDGSKNECNWNDAVGVEVAQAIIDYCKTGTFIDVDDTTLATGVANGDYVAAVSGTWNADAFKTAMGDGYAACKLPTFKAGGKEYQMGSFGGCKLVGVNPYSEFVGWSMLLAEFLTSEESQTLRFNERSLGPSNAKAFNSAEVQSNVAIVAVTEQSEFATPQIIGGKFWDPSATLGKILAEGNPEGKDLQEILNTTVEGICAAQD